MLPRALLIPVASWFGAGMLPRGARVIALFTALPIAVVLAARWPVLGCLVAGTVIATVSAWAAQCVRVERNVAGPRTEIVGGAAAALMIALVPARPTVIELATACIALALLLHARPPLLRAIDQRFTETAGDLALGIAVAIVVALERASAA